MFPGRAERNRILDGVMGVGSSLFGEGRYFGGVFAGGMRGGMQWLVERRAPVVVGAVVAVGTEVDMIPVSKRLNVDVQLGWVQIRKLVLGLVVVAEHRAGAVDNQAA